MIIDILVDLTIKDDLYLITKPLNLKDQDKNTKINKSSQIYKVNIIRDIPFYIPINILFMDNLYTRLHHKKKSIQYYQNFYYIQDHEMLAELNLRFEMNLFDHY